MGPESPLETGDRYQRAVAISPWDFPAWWGGQIEPDKWPLELARLPGQAHAVPQVRWGRKAAFEVLNANRKSHTHKESPICAL